MRANLFRMDFALKEIANRLENLFRIASIEEIEGNRARVEWEDGHISGFLKILEVRMGASRSWEPPVIGEQVLVFCPGGKLELGLIGPSLEQALFPEISQDKATHVREFSDGAKISYDHENHALKAFLPEGGTSHIIAPGGHVLEGNVTLKHNLTVEGEVVGKKSAKFYENVTDKKRSMQGIVDHFNGDHLGKHVSTVQKMT